MPLVYPIQRNQDKREASFISSEGISYETYFLEANSYFDDSASLRDDLYIFGFSASVYTYKSGQDPKVSNTLIEIINQEFVDNPSLIMLYVCDQSDGKQSFRKRLFDKWFGYYSNNEFLKSDIVIDEVVFISAIYRSNHSQLSNIKKMLQDFKKGLDEK